MVTTKSPGRVDVKGKARFQASGGAQWTSNHAWAQFMLSRNGCKVICTKRYEQRSINDNQYVKPRFRKKEFQRMKDKALAMLTRPAVRNENPPARRGHGGGGHQQVLCTKCEELGFPCTGNLVDVCNATFNLTHSAMRARKRRLAQGEPMVLYHQTTPEIAEKIIESQEMKPGSVGMAGGGVYFATTPEDTHGKALRTGRILECRVRLGRTKELGASGDASLDIVKLLNDESGPYDSVRIGRPRPEYVVYMSDQVFDIKHYVRS